MNLEKILDAESGIKGTYEITIYGVDETQGMLSVKVTEHYKNLSFDRTITSEATVIHEAKAATP